MNLLNGITIIDFTRLVLEPVATHLLAQMGAEVIKIECSKRMEYARASDKQVDNASILFYQLNHNKTMKMVNYATELENSNYHQSKNTFKEFETPNGTKLTTIALPFKA